ncbi:hypothetical protein MKX01_018606 [Papaver californicum]|nr:hypothetical protein MKX01_018606 [Papaver californicum]
MDACKLFYCIPKLKILRMSDFIYEGLCFANVLGTSLRTFNSLTCLVLAWMSCLNIRKLFDFLHNSPILESLVFDKSICHDTDDGLINDSVPRCMLLHMKSVEFNNYNGSTSDMYVLDFFLKNALVLQKMTIRLCRSYLPVDSENKAMENLLLFPRGSTRCIVELL